MFLYLCQGSALFKKIGYAPLNDYLNCDDLEDQKVARTLLGQYSNTVIDAMIDAINNNDSNSEPMGTTLWMIGHAIYLPAAALGIASITECSESWMDIILSTNTKEAEGYLIDIQNGSAKYLSRPSTKLQQ